MFSTRHGLTFLFIFILLLSLLGVLTSGILPGAEGSSEEGVTFSNIKINTGSGDEDIEFVFIVRITSAAPPAYPVEVVVGGHARTMKEVDPSDKNYSDGKDFQYKAKFEPGPKFYFFRCGNHTTVAYTFDVTEENFIQYHPDLALVLAIYVIPIIYFLILLRRMTDNSASLGNTLIEIEHDLDGERSTTREGGGQG